MKFNLKGCLLLFSTLFMVTTSTYSQLQFSLEVRPRAEYRHGFKSLAVIDQEPAFFIDQRTRFSSLFMNDNISIKLSLQDVRVWGNQPQLVIGDGNLTSLHEGWAKFKMNSKLSLKLGRQEISYDDQRILGSVGWAQQARSHDAAVFIYQDSTFTGHLGTAFNQSSAGLVSTAYTINNNYKALQYLWLNKKWDRANLSVLFLNNGVQVSNEAGVADGTNFSQTYGARLGLNFDNVLFNSAIYYQGGKQANLQATKIDAYYIGADFTYLVSPTNRLTFGAEILSGNDLGNDRSENNAFTPFYGTNHKFNGLMDYFFVGNHINNVGLNDLFLQWGFKKSKFSAGVHLHYFTSNGEVTNGIGTQMSSYLGTEIDFVFGFPITKDVNLKSGYSQMFGSDTMVAIKNGGSIESTSNWFWTMITVKPSFGISIK